MQLAILIVTIFIPLRSHLTEINLDTKLKNLMNKNHNIMTQYSKNRQVYILVLYTYLKMYRKV